VGRLVEHGPDDFFDEKKDWSRVKHSILKKYLDIYTNIRGSKNPLLFFIDGFAGPGWYGSGDQREQGSPILAAELAQRAISEGKPYRLHCILVEGDPDRAEQLAEAMSGFDRSLATVMPGPFSEWRPTILRQIGDHPALFFLDPWGVKGIELSDIQSLLDRPDTELLIRLDAERLRRLAGNEDSAAPESVGKLRRVSLVVGEDPDDPEGGWLGQWRQLGSSLEWEEWAVATYARRLRERSPHLQHAVPYPVRETYRSRPKYYLIFATRYPPAVGYMNEVVCIEDENLFSSTEAVRGAQLSFLGDIHVQERESRLRDLMEEIHQYGIAHQRVSRSDIMQHFAVRRFGQFMKKHYRQAIDALVAAGRARYDGRANDKAPIIFLSSTRVDPS